MARLLIEIPDELYEEVKKDKYYKYGNEVWDIVKKGRVLPIEFQHFNEDEVIIYRFDSFTPCEHLKYIFEILKEAFPNHKVIGICKDISIDTITIERLVAILKELKGE